MKPKHQTLPTRFTIILQAEPEGGFSVTVPQLPGCFTCGETIEEAKTMAIDAIRCHLESLDAEESEIIPFPDEPIMSSVEVDFSSK